MSQKAGRAPGLTGMAEAVLSEIATRAVASSESGRPDAIDLASIPLTLEDRASLETRLGRGEVFATIETAGRSEIWETAYSGIWFVRHFREDGCVALETIEIGDAPRLLFSHRADRLAGAARLTNDLSGRRNTP